MRHAPGTLTSMGKPPAFELLVKARDRAVLGALVDEIGAQLLDLMPAHRSLPSANVRKLWQGGRGPVTRTADVVRRCEDPELLATIWGADARKQVRRALWCNPRLPLELWAEGFASHCITADATRSAGEQRVHETPLDDLLAVTDDLLRDEGRRSAHRVLVNWIVTHPDLTDEHWWRLFERRPHDALTALRDSELQARVSDALLVLCRDDDELARHAKLLAGRCSPASIGALVDRVRGATAPLKFGGALVAAAGRRDLPPEVLEPLADPQLLTLLSAEAVRQVVAALADNERVPVSCVEALPATSDTVARLLNEHRAGPDVWLLASDLLPASEGMSASDFLRMLQTATAGSES